MRFKFSILLNQVRLDKTNKIWYSFLSKIKIKVKIIFKKFNKLNQNDKLYLTKESKYGIVFYQT